MKKLIVLTAAVAAMAVLFSCEKKAAAPELSVNPLTADFEAAGGDKDIAVTSNVDWTVTASKEWVTVSPKSGNGNGTVKIIVDPNDGVSVREADVTIAAGDNLSKVVKIAQLGQEPALAVSPESVADVAVAGADVDVDVTANVAWTASVPEGVDWLTVAPASGEGTAKVKLTVAANASPRARNTTVTFTAGSLSKTVSVAQVAGLGTRQTDSLALVAIYNAIDKVVWKSDKQWNIAENNTIDKWNTSAIKLSALTEGMKESERRVITINITALVANAMWELPEEIGDLKELTTLKLNKNIKGTLPESVYTLPKLEKFYFENGDLEGNIETIGNLTTLKEIYVDGNAKLAGTIPASIGNLKDLQKFNIAKTAITGSIPAEITQCTKLDSFLANESKLTGEIPDSWDKCTAMSNFTCNDVAGLTGPLPKTFGAFTKMTTGINMANCNFTGNIPEEWANVGNCTTMKLFGNKLKGVVPATVQAHPKWSASNGWKPATNILPQQDGYGLTLE